MRSTVALLVTDAAIAVGFAVSYAIFTGGCVYPSPLFPPACLPCVIVYSCEGPWAWLPRLLWVAAIVGLLPAALAAALVRASDRRSWVPPRWLPLLLPGISAGMFALWLEPLETILLGLLLWPLSAALLLPALYRWPMFREYSGVR